MTRLKYKKASFLCRLMNFCACDKKFTGTEGTEGTVPNTSLFQAIFLNLFIDKLADIVAKRHSLHDYYKLLHDNAPDNLILDIGNSDLEESTEYTGSRLILFLIFARSK